MRTLLKAVALWISVALAPAILSACATIGLPAQTPAQKLYAAHGAYNHVLSRFVSYAERPTASVEVVKKGQVVNKRMRKAFKYAEAMVTCGLTENRGKLPLSAISPECGLFSFDNDSVSRNAAVLRSGVIDLDGLLARVSQ